MTNKPEKPSERDLYEDLPDGFDHFIIDRAGTSDDPVPPDDHPPGAHRPRPSARVALGMLSILRPRGRSTVYHQTLQAKKPAMKPDDRVDFRKAPAEVEIRPVLPADVPLALSLVIRELGENKIDFECKPALSPKEKQVDPGWVGLVMTNEDVFGAIYSGSGWPTWDEEWHLPSNTYNLGTFDGTVYDKPMNYQAPAGLIHWHHKVSALTGTYEGEDNTEGTWLLVKSGTTKVAVIHQIPISAGSEYVDTWWLSSNFVWWGNGDVPATVMVESDPGKAKSVRSGFSTTTRYKHVVTKVTQA